MGQPIVERVIHGVTPPGPQAVVDLQMQFPELVTDLGLGPAGDLPADAPAARD
jgi:hypothetical protein